jgi:recombination protein RecA
MRFASPAVRRTTEAISTGSLGLDAALGIGGLPRGRLTEIYGPEASGKTTLALHSIAEAQRTGGIAAFIDAEHALDAAYASQLGIKADSLLVAQPETGEQALEIVEILVRSGALDVIVIDSVAALVPKAELDGDLRHAPLGLQAHLMAQGLRKLTAVVGKSSTCIVFVNQLRHKIGHVVGSPETTPGGHALKFHAAVRLEVRRMAPRQHTKAIDEHRLRVRVVKNKLAPPFRQAEFAMLPGQGIDSFDELLELAVAQGLVRREGLWYAYETMRLGPGHDHARDFLQQTPDLTHALETRLRQRLALPGSPGSAPEP